MWLELRGVERRFGQTVAVSGLDLTLPQGAIGCLLGPSGCGKTTALRCVAGFEPVDAGEIYARKRLLSSRDVTVPPATRNIGMVFQDYALFPHLSVLETSGSGCMGNRGRRASGGRLTCWRSSAWKTAERGIPMRFPVASSSAWRWLARWPRSLIWSCWTNPSRTSTSTCAAGEPRGPRILKQVNATALLVTHDQNEAFAMADLVGVMQNGRLEQWDAPYELYHRPATRFVADFIGQGASCPARWWLRRPCHRTGLLAGDVPRDIPPVVGSTCC